MKSSSNLNISCKVVLSLNKWNKKVGSLSSFRRKRPFISLNSSASIENLSSSGRARTSVRANHAKNDAQKGCAMQLNGITLTTVYGEKMGLFQKLILLSIIDGLGAYPMEQLILNLKTNLFIMIGFVQHWQMHA